MLLFIRNWYSLENLWMSFVSHYVTRHFQGGGSCFCFSWSRCFIFIAKLRASGSIRFSQPSILPEEDFLLGYRFRFYIMPQVFKYIFKKFSVFFLYLQSFAKNIGKIASSVFSLRFRFYSSLIKNSQKATLNFYFNSRFSVKPSKLQIYFEKIVVGMGYLSIMI